MKDGGWLIPADAEKPGGPLREEVEISPFLKKLRYQQERNNHFGIYEYLQLNTAYSSNRMASKPAEAAAGGEHLPHQSD